MLYLHFTVRLRMKKHSLKKRETYDNRSVEIENTSFKVFLNGKLDFRERKGGETLYKIIEKLTNKEGETDEKDCESN